MSDEVVERLRGLARRYAEGQLSRRDYLSMRTGLLDAVTGHSQRSGAGEPVVGDAPAAHPVPDNSLADTPAAGLGPRERLASDADQPTATTRPASGKNRALMVTVLGVGLTVVVLAALWLVSAGPGSDADVSTTAAPQKVSVADSAKSSARSRVEAFMARNDWSPPAIGDFLSAWEELPESLRRDALGAAWFKPLSDELNERIAEQQALADIRGPDGGSGEYETLVTFAERLGLK